MLETAENPKNLKTKFHSKKMPQDCRNQKNPQNPKVLGEPPPPLIQKKSILRGGGVLPGLWYQDFGIFGFFFEFLQFWAFSFWNEIYVFEFFGCLQFRAFFFKALPNPGFYSGEPNRPLTSTLLKSIAIHLPFLWHTSAKVCRPPGRK